MERVYIISAVRTATGNFGGALKTVPATKLGAIVIKEAIRRANINNREVDEVVMGNVLQGGAGQNPARQSLI